MSSFGDYLQDIFPLLHQSLTLERINTHGLVYTWQGKNQSLGPILFLGHQDVVPVPPETKNLWIHPPLSGDFDGTYVWGRGSTDCKSSLIAMMEAVEELLGAGFAPEKTAILALEFDEEISGYQGGKHIAEHLRQRYEEDGIALLIDEGPGFFHFSKLNSTYALCYVSKVT